MDQPTGRIAPRYFEDMVAPDDDLSVTRRHDAARGFQPFRPLPRPTGLFPYHLALADLLPRPRMTEIGRARRLVFHMAGDTGGIRAPGPQMNVARQMVHDLESSSPPSRPAFFYHLGDIVYFYGASEEYFPQFYEPYMRYGAPIVAIPGNHDGDLSRGMESAGIPSLAAFVDNFCQRSPHHTRDALDARRSAMTQPNVYWTLTSPLATIVGLYTNVPEGGRLDEDQIAWLAEELAAAPRDRALLVAMHHPIYSGDDHHGGSAYMGAVLDEAVARSRHPPPDAVFAGHVHNYQRFTRKTGGRSIPYLVVGAGGYHNLHPLSRALQAAAASGPLAVSTAAMSATADDVVLETYCDTLFGFLRLNVTADTITGDYFTVPGFQQPASTGHFDSFVLDLKTHTVTTHPVGASTPGPDDTGR